MNELVIIIGASWLAGVAAFLGALVARFEGTAETVAKREMIHGVVAFGGGVLVAAVAFALAPEGIAILSTPVLAVTFCLGGIIFCVLDARLSAHGGTKSQFVAMLLDFIPEAISLGAVFGEDHRLGFLLAAFIGVQNLPEGFNSFREIVASGVSRGAALAAFFAVSLLGPVASFVGYVFLQNQAKWTAGMMSFAAGGILYLIFQDIAPQSKMRRHWSPPLGAVLGFAVGMMGTKVIG